jgi:hypothetical protein
MSLLSVAFHAALADLGAGIASLKAKLVAAEPEVAADFTDIVTGLETQANTLTAEAASAVVTEAATVPVFGAALASALTAATPIALADLKAAYAALGTFLEGYEATVVPAIIAKV